MAGKATNAAQKKPAAKAGAAYALFAFFMLAGAAAAASEPLLQIKEYSTVPEEVYPGTLGYLQLTLSNTGSATAQSVTAYYDLEGVRRTVSLGDIGTSSSAQVSIPFKISQSSGGSIQLLTSDIFYSFTSGSTVQSNSLSLSIPLIVAQYSPLDVKVLSAGGTAISPGERLTLELELANSGGVVNNLIITMPENSTFSIDGSTQKAVGTLLQNSTAKVSLPLFSSSDAKIGTYGIPVVFTYQDSLRQPTSQAFYLGPVSVLDSSSQYRLSLEPASSVEIGSQAPFTLTLENKGAYPVSGAVDIGSTDTFTPVGSSRIYFDSVPAGKSASKQLLIGVLATETSGYYSLPVTFTPDSGQPAEYSMGIAVSATPEITITLDPASTALSVQIANTGNSQVRSVYASAKPLGSQAKSESFIGTLDVDDFSSIPISSAATARSVDVEVRFKDTDNQEHVLKQTLELSGNSSFSGQGNRTLAPGASSAGAANSGGFQRSSNPLGFLMGPGGRAPSASASGGTDYLLMGGAAVAVVVVGYFAYRKFFAKKKGNAKPEAHAKPKQ